MLLSPNLATDLVTKNKENKEGRAKLLKRKWWAIQDLNL